MLGIVACAASTGGCMSAIKQAYYEARGAKAKVHPVQEPRPADFVACRALSFAPARTTVGPRICPGELLEAYDRAAATYADDDEAREVFPGGEPALHVDSEFVYFQEKGAFSAAECLLRVRLSEASRTVLDCVVKAESKAYTSGGEDDLADAAIEALVKFVGKQKRRAAGRHDDENDE